MTEKVKVSAIGSLKMLKMLVFWMNTQISIEGKYAKISVVFAKDLEHHAGECLQILVSQRIP